MCLRVKDFFLHVLPFSDLLKFSLACVVATQSGFFFLYHPGDFVSQSYI